MTLIGLGYLFVARDVTQNRALVWLGILAKAFDVVVLTWREIIGMTEPIVLIPAGIDAAFTGFFIWFLIANPNQPG